MSKSSNRKLNPEEKEFAEFLVSRLFTFRNFAIGLDVKVPGLGTLSPRPDYKRKVKELFKAVRKKKKIKVAKKYKGISLEKLNKIVILNNKLSLPKVNVKRKRTMSTKVPESSGVDFKSLPNGPYAATCYGIAIVGTLEKDFQGKKSKSLYIRIFFDIPSEEYTYEKDGEEITKTYVISHQITFTPSPKGNLLKLLNPWSGGVVDKEKIKNFDVATMVGKSALITIETKPGKNGKSYTNLVGITTLPKGMPLPKTKKEKFIFDINEWDKEKFKMLPGWVMKIVAQSDEFKAQGHRLEDYLEPKDGEGNEPEQEGNAGSDSWG